MINLMGAMKILASHQPLPQSKQPEVTPEMSEALLAEAQGVLKEVLRDSEDPAASLVPRLEGIAAKYGWYPTSMVLCYSFARYYGPEMVPSISSMTKNAINLLKMLPIAASSEDRDEGAWTIPGIIIAEAGEQEALEFTACAALCAGIGAVENSLKEKAGEKTP